MNNPKDENPIENLTLPITEYKGLLFGEFGDDEWPSSDIKPLSAGIGDIAKIKIIKWELGVLIKDTDPQERLYHVEFFQNTRTTMAQTVTSWAEVWLIRDWLESNARRERFRKAEAAKTAEYSKSSALKQEIVDELEGHGLTKQQLAELAEAIALNWEKHDLSGLLKNLQLDEVVVKYKNKT